MLEPQRFRKISLNIRRSCGEETLPVEVILEDGFAAVAPMNQGVDGSGIFEAQLTGHGGCLPTHAPCVNVEDPFPFW